MPSSPHQRLSEFRVAVLPSIPWLPVDSEIMNAVENLAKEVSKKSAKVKKARPQVPDDMRHYALCRPRGEGVRRVPAAAGLLTWQVGAHSSPAGIGRVALESTLGDSSAPSVP